MYRYLIGFAAATALAAAAHYYREQTADTARIPGVGDEIYVSFPDSTSPVGRRGTKLVVSTVSLGSDEGDRAAQSFKRTPDDWMIHLGGNAHTAYLLAHPVATPP